VMVAIKLMNTGCSWPLQYLDGRVLSLLSLRFKAVPSLGWYKLYIYNNTGG
jgi:hypothetical protein